jgi:5S rRNA maturation endonuclease (ribonuclease M5)
LKLRTISLPRQSDCGEWAYKVKGFIDPVPYKLPQLLSAIRHLKRIFLVEGERKADKLRALDLEATCNPFGCKWKWTDEFVEYFRGAEIIILPDHDDPGHAWAAKCVRLLTGVAVSVKIVSLGLKEQGADIVDWLDAGHTAEELLALVDGVTIGAGSASRYRLSTTNPKSTTFSNVRSQFVTRRQSSRDRQKLNPRRAFLLHAGLFS